MYAVGRLSSYISRGVYTVSGPFHPFGGAVDIIVVEQQDGSFKSSPWYVHFGKFQGVLKAREKIVDISVNGMETRLQMYLDHKGEAYFLKEVDGEESDSVLYPSSSGDEIDEKSQTCDWDANEQKIVDQIDLADGKIVGRTNSRRSRILGLVFGRRSMKEEGLREEAGGDAGMVRASSLERAELAADLLDVKWTTNLSTKKPKKDKTSRFSAPGAAAGEANRESRISRGQSQGSSFVDDETEIRLDHSLLFDETGSLDGDVGKSSDSGSEKSKCSVGESVAQNFSLSLLKQDVEICNLDSKELEERCDFMPVTSENTGAGYSEETETKRAQSYLYCETSESSRLSMDGSSEETQDPICISSENCDEVHVHAETLHVSEVHSPQEPSVLSTNEHLNNLVVFRDGDGSNTINDSKVLESEGIVTETVSSVEIQSITCNAVENEVFEVINQDTRTCLIEPKGMRAVDKDHSDDTDTSELQSTMDSIKNPQELNFYVQEKSISPSEGSKEERSLFNDLDFNPIEVQNMESSFPNRVEKESGPLDMPGGFEGAEKLVTKKYESHSLPSNSVLENFPSDSGELIENLKMTSNPISIPRSHFAADEETGKMVKSLPNIWSHADNLDSLQLIFPPSRSLDSSSKSLNWSLSRKDIAGFIRSDADKGYELRPEQPTAEGKQISAELQNFIASPGVEISLCKHLLYEGMGLETASEAFDSEKLDVENFSSLVSDIRKKDRLVVRISNHYFPWDAAVPIMLGMTCPGNKELIEPKGMIAVDQVEKTSEGDPSKAIISNGNWRIWPFLFKSSRAKRSSQPTQNGSRTSSVENDLESSVGMGTSKENVTRKKVRTITPTSEQMASLNLKEGRNIVTFSYSTGMLGKQKVDARIYLWKWNTHIVISDVDGTITRSDVLGQFMPMVGVDWSHTGVAHLFSAIKENGYQLLFLSARAISQAYNTRQFLFNLKQDGKALPDGPVVISPNGLFPSLFREVIRRAPHEFKIGCLEDIKALFPSDCNPFYAGFGNRDTDEVSYLKVGIPKGKIFIINPKGQVAVNRRIDTKSYTSLHALVNGMFPPISSSSSEQEDYNSWNFWRMPFPTIDA